MEMRLFCGNCWAYTGPGCQKCPQCGREVPPHALRYPPGAAAWREPIQLAGHPVGQSGLLAPWVVTTWQKGLQGGGVSVLDTSGAEVARQTFVGIPKDGPLVGQLQIMQVVSGLLDGGGVWCWQCSPVGPQMELAWKQDDHRIIPAKPNGGGVVFENRLYVPALDGSIYCLDLRNGEPVPGWPVKVSRGLRYLFVKEPFLVAVCRDSGQVYRLDLIRGQPDAPLVTLDPGLACKPVFWNNHLYLCSRDGRIVKAGIQKQTVSDFVQAAAGVNAQPVVKNGVMIAPGTDHRLYAWDENGQPVWQSDWRSEYPLTTSPAVAEDVLAVGDHNGQVVGVDPDTGGTIWTFQSGLAGAICRDPLYHDGIFYLGLDRKTDESGYLQALPVCFGEYEYFANKAALRNQAEIAGELYAAAAYFETQPEKRSQLAELAVRQWRGNGHAHLAAGFWENEVRLDRAAGCWQEAADNLRGRDNPQAAEFLQRAARLYWRLGQGEQEAHCAGEAARLAHWPHIRILLLNNPVQVIGKPGPLTVRVENIGHAPALNLHFDVGGSLLQPINFNLLTPLEPECHCDLSFVITPTREDDLVQISVAYGVGGRPKPMSTVFSTRVSARKVTRIKVGDLVLGEIKVVGETGEELEIETGDVVRSKIEIVMAGRMDPPVGRED